MTEQLLAERNKTGSAFTFAMAFSSEW